MKARKENANLKRSDSHRMKSFFQIGKYLLVGALLVVSTFSNGQENSAINNNKQTLVVLNIDTKITNTSPENLGNMSRMEVEALNLYSVMDRYDVAYLVEKNKLNITECYGNTCLTEIGNILHADKMLT